MKKAWFLLVTIVIAAGLWLVLKSPNHTTPVPVTPDNPGSAAGGNKPGGNNSPAPGAPDVLPATPEAAPVVATQAATTTIATSSAPAISGLPPLTVLDNARVVMHNYASVFGENPVGDNSEITATLMGKNPKQVNFIPEESGLRVNDKGELIDAWGTPFFFHQLSGKVMEIRSAGEDRKMWTFDDQVTR
ncbi:MAG: hypothetical protein P4N60_11660 [Verrucomicrobiae bacterium]|nr:hypothetical protein [Verrucomicrobiae bacterium]